MKKTVSLVLALLLALSLVACGNSNNETPDVQEPVFGMDLTQFYNDIMAAAEEGPFMMDIAADAEMLESVYPGLKDIQTKQLVAYTPAMSAVAIEFVFVEVVNAADVEAVKAIFQTRIDNQVAGGAWYPETIEGWQNNSEIVVIDNYVCLFVCSEKDGMIDAFRNGTEVPAWAKAQTGNEGGDGIGDMEEMIPSEDDIPAYDPEADVPAVDGVNLEAFYNDLYAELYPLDAEGYSTGPFVEDFAAMPEMLDGFYPGLSAVSTKQLHVYMPMMSGVPYELVLVEVANASDVETVKAIMQARIDTETANQMNYPMVIENWELNSRIAVNGNYIMMAVTSDCDAYVDAFNALF